MVRAEIIKSLLEWEIINYKYVYTYKIISEICVILFWVWVGFEFLKVVYACALCLLKKSNLIW